MWEPAAKAAGFCVGEAGASGIPGKSRFGNPENPAKGIDGFSALMLYCLQENATWAIMGGEKMLKEKLQEMRENGGEPFCCLGNSRQAGTDWLAAGGDPAHILSKRQVESFLMTGSGFPEAMAFEGSLPEFIRLFPMRAAENARDTINRILQNGVAEWTGEGWECYTCRVAVLGCCMGEYLSVVNRKEV